jgi:hypothetical protein
MKELFMRRPVLALGVAIAAVAVVFVSGCSEADTSPSQKALHYSNGPFSSRTFQDCVDPGSLKYQGVSDDHFYYPVGQRTLNFSHDEGADSPPLTITSRDGQVMEVSGILAFHLNTSCEPYTDKAGKRWDGGILQKFHETIAAQDAAYATSGGAEPGGGWDQVVNKYVRNPAERGVSNEALNFGWQDLFEKSDAKAAWEKASVTEIPRLVLEQTGEPFFVIDSVLLQKPDPSPTLKTELGNNQAAALRAQTAATDQAAAANFPGGIGAYIAYQGQLAVNKAIADGKVQVLPVPQGSPVIINGTR